MGVKVGEGGKLYGSINNQDIADALGRRGITVDKHKIDLDQPIKALGTYKVAIKVFTGMTPEVTIGVEPKADLAGAGPAESPLERPDGPAARALSRHPALDAAPVTARRHRVGRQSRTWASA